MFETLKDLIMEFVEVEAENITPGAKLIEDLGFNSYDLMCLIGQVEITYDIEVEEKEVGKLRTVGEVLDYIANQAA